MDRPGAAARSSEASAPNDAIDAAVDVHVGNDASGDQTSVPAGSRRVVGYVPNWNGSYTTWATRLDFSKLTHINLAFANAGNGNNRISLANDADIAALVTAAHRAGVKVLPSLGGASGSDGLTTHYAAANVDAFVDSIDQYMTAHDFDGIDVDVESPGSMGAPFGTFIQKLGAKVHAKGKLLSAAVAQWIQRDMPDASLAVFDFINVMSYDACGTWTDACEHATYDQALGDLDYYANTKHVPKNKIVLGVPFYGYCWGACPDGYNLYTDILKAHPDAWNKDWIDQGGAKWSYNGQPTMMKKAALAKQYGGLMIWEMSGDVAGDHSLLQTIATNY